MKALKAIVIGMGVLIVMAVGLIGFGLYKKSVEPGWKLFGKPAVISTPSGGTIPIKPFADINLTLPDDCMITDIRPDGPRAYVITGPESVCNSVIVIDVTNGSILGRIEN